MNIYEKIEKIVEFNDLVDCGHKLIEFADNTMKASNRATLIKYFYERLYQNALTRYTFNRSGDMFYYICEKNEAIGMCLLCSIGGKQTPVKSLIKIKEAGNHIITDYREPVGENISKSTILEILEHLDTKYSFSKKVFNRKPLIYAVIPNSHIEFNSLCAVTSSNTIPIVFLYHMKVNDMNIVNPIAVFFHELGHVLHACFANTPNQVPDNILDYLQKLCFPSIKDAPCSTQCEIFADVLSVGLMQDTKYEEYSLFKSFHSNDKKAFKILAEQLLMERGD